MRIEATRRRMKGMKTLHTWACVAVIIVALRMMGVSPGNVAELGYVVALGCAVVWVFLAIGRWNEKRAEARAQIADRRAEEDARAGIVCACGLMSPLSARRCDCGSAIRPA